MGFRTDLFYKLEAKNTKLNSNYYSEIRENIIRTLAEEADALKTLQENISDEMCSAVQHIYETNARLVVTGIGKSAIVAQKIVATLNSTGTSAVFMHAADAIHGDLGLVSRDDIILCLSKSGDTPEIKVLVPLIREFGNKIIAMVSHPDSYLARQADYCLHLPVTREADPNNLAPTTSTTLQMAMGDALAVSLLTLKGFSQDNFAKLHPGGSLGRQLYMKVADLVGKHDKPAVVTSDLISDVILEISSKRLGSTAVLDREGKLCGIITDGDLRRMLQTGQDIKSLVASEIMSHHPKTIDMQSLAVDALQMMRKHSITQLIATDGDRYAGMVHLHDILREGII